MKPSAREIVIKIQSLSVEDATKLLNDFIKVKKEFVPPEFEVVKKFFIDNGYVESHAKKAFDYYANDAEPSWTDNTGKPVKNWKQKMRANWMKNEGKAVPLPQSKQSTLQVNKDIFGR